MLFAIDCRKNARLGILSLRIIVMKLQQFAAFCVEIVIGCSVLPETGQ